MRIITNAGIAGAFPPTAVLATAVKSKYATTPARDEFFIKFKYWLPSGGIAVRRA